jgi:hypothetical protein
MCTGRFEQNRTIELTTQKKNPFNLIDTVCDPPILYVQKRIPTRLGNPARVEHELNRALLFLGSSLPWFSDVSCLMTQQQ